MDLTSAPHPVALASGLAGRSLRGRGATPRGLDAPSPAACETHTTIHPSLWRAHQLGGGGTPAVATGFAALDAELPGGGWPHRLLTELLLPHPGVGEMRLLAPALAAISRGVAGETAASIPTSRCIMLFDPPAALAPWVLGQLGVDLQQTIVVYGREGARGAAVLRRLLPSADALWAMEQALRSGQVGAVLAWPPDRLRADTVRRLQLAAARHDGPVFLFRDLRTRLEASPAPLRLALHAAGPGGLSVHLLKRRGPALLRPLTIALPSVLPPALHNRWQQRWQARNAAGATGAAADAVAGRA
jgi:protein ImuA